LVGLLLTTRVASADSCALRPVFSNTPLTEISVSGLPICYGADTALHTSHGRLVGAGIIYLYANDEAKFSSLNNVLKAIEHLEGYKIQPGETFSFNKAANLLQEFIPYDLGPDVRGNLVKAGGVCMISSMIATAAHDAGLPFVNGAGKIIPRPVPHSRYFKYYHQVNRINNRSVPITEAAVAIRKDRMGENWRTVQDMQFINNTGRILVLHFEPSFSYDDLNLAEPFGLLQENHMLKVEIRSVPNGMDAWLNRLIAFSVN
jgi:hypothetical protein